MASACSILRAHHTLLHCNGGLRSKLVNSSSNSSFLESSSLFSSSYIFRTRINIRAENGRTSHPWKQSLRVFSESISSGIVPEGRAKPEWTPEIVKVVEGMKWDANGLVIAIAQNELTGAIMMQGFADKDAIAATISSGRATFYSRSRKSLWTKGETSKNFISVSNVYIDCDKDSVVYLGQPDGPTCHTGSTTCFFSEIVNISNGDVKHKNGDRVAAEPLSTLYALEKTIEKRKEVMEKQTESKPSWTVKLLQNPSLTCSKIREEADELCRTWEDKEGKERAASEMADLLYHSMVLLNLHDVKIEDEMKVLNSRFAISGIQEKANRFK